MACAMQLLECRRLGPRQDLFGRSVWQQRMASEMEDAVVVVAESRTKEERHLSPRMIPSNSAYKRSPEGYRKGNFKMKRHPCRVLVPGILAAAAALALVTVVGAQMPPGPPPTAKSPQAAPMPGHHMDRAVKGEHDAEMKTECQAMMAKKQAMQDKLQANDAALDKLVAQMNAAQGSKKVDAMEKTMVAVINELVAQRKASHSMTMEMQSAMMAHMMRHMDMQGTKGAMECPMMGPGNAHEPKAEEKMPKM